MRKAQDVHGARWTTGFPAARRDVRVVRCALGRLLVAPDTLRSTRSRDGATLRAGSAVAPNVWRVEGKHGDGRSTYIRTSVAGNPLALKSIAGLRVSHPGGGQ